MSLATYRKKRNFSVTREPRAGKTAAKAAGRQFVIQKHDASRLHYDLRLEIGGTFKSWAVPKGLPAAKGDKRLAMHVEDHPLAYGKFEGIIPKGEYGGGTVMLWDRGTFTPLTKSPAKDLAGGKLHFILEGEKLRGEWYLVRLREGNEWLVIKGGESMKPLSKKTDDTSILSGKNMKELAGGEASPEKTVKKTPASSKAKRAPARPARSKTAKTPALPRFRQPMKARLVTEPPKGDWIYEIKFDGWRALALKGGDAVQLLSRNEKDLSAKFPEIAEAIAGLDAGDAIFDGEITALDSAGRSSFQLLQAYDIGGERPPLVFYLFDLLQLNGRDLTAQPLAERKAALEKIVKTAGSDLLRFSEDLGGDAHLLIEKARQLGIEGLIGKRAESVYESGSRSGAWIKLKLHHEQEFIIGGYTDPEGSRTAFGSLLIGFQSHGKLQFCGKVGTGFNHALLKSLYGRMKKLSVENCPFANLPEPKSRKWGQAITASEMKRCHWIRPELVGQVKFSEWTRDGRLRQPVFLGLREDKDPAEVVRETPASP